MVAWGPKVKVPRENHDKVLSPFMSQPQRYYGPAMICYSKQLQDIYTPPFFWLGGGQEMERFSKFTQMQIL